MYAYITHPGSNSIPAGRPGDAPTVKVAETLERVGFILGRLKTGESSREAASTVLCGKMF